eukprot:COSAG04_NODE_3432_length_2819_cov_1.798897_1_plen_223_part_00
MLLDRFVEGALPQAELDVLARRKGVVHEQDLLVVVPDARPQRHHVRIGGLLPLGEQLLDRLLRGAALGQQLPGAVRRLAAGLHRAARRSHTPRPTYEWGGRRAGAPSARRQAHGAGRAAAAPPEQTRSQLSVGGRRTRRSPLRPTISAPPLPAPQAAEISAQLHRGRWPEQKEPEHGAPGRGRGRPNQKMPKMPTRFNSRRRSTCRQKLFLLQMNTLTCSCR